MTGYLVEEVLNTQPPEVRDMMLSTSILECFSADIASDLVSNELAAGILPALARVNAFVQPLGRGWYRYHTLFAEVLRLKLRREHPDRIAHLHRRAALWYERNGALTDAVRHAAEAGDWHLAASMVIDGLAIGEILEPRGSHSLAGLFRNMPTSEALERDSAVAGLRRRRVVRWPVRRNRCGAECRRRHPGVPCPPIKEPSPGWPPRWSASPPAVVPGISLSQRPPLPTRR